MDKVVDVIVTAMSMRGTLHDIEDLDLAYAPPFSTAIHPIVHTVNVLFNKINGVLESIAPAEYLMAMELGILYLIHVLFQQ